jgi:hypothetical protein
VGWMRERSGDGLGVDFFGLSIVVEAPKCGKVMNIWEAGGVVGIYERRGLPFAGCRILCLFGMRRKVVYRCRK